MKLRLSIFNSAFAAGMVACAQIATPVLAAPDDVITITPADFKVPKDRILPQLSRLEAMSSASVDTADYATTFNNFQNDLSKATPTLNDWPKEERDRVYNLPAPSKAAWDALRTENEAAQQRRQAREQELARDQQLRVEQQRLNDEQRRDAERAEQEARLNEARIRESEARSDYYENSYPLYGQYWWWNGPGRPIRPRPRQDMPGQPKNLPRTQPIIDDYKGRPRI